MGSNQAEEGTAPRSGGMLFPVILPPALRGVAITLPPHEANPLNIHSRPP
eukprot:NODE_7803_length_254_cov_253.160976_g7188_i0.p3 GENE.NODE_7803_length_254_cov_253.160976_g7188_i0~~NODE_7803_length_254_cov_253.160976_g7188_i0.p3  ORF type:complete len:58 (-),score=19.62 NODE_7803_length_254_cov_253.160976_g7188_i0:81-230(-)